MVGRLVKIRDLGDRRIRIEVTSTAFQACQRNLRIQARFVGWLHIMAHWSGPKKKRNFLHQRHSFELKLNGGVCFDIVPVRCIKFFSANNCSLFVLFVNSGCDILIA